jgi:hypothetical protein
VLVPFTVLPLLKLSVNTAGAERHGPGTTEIVTLPAIRPVLPLTVLLASTV